MAATTNTVTEVGVLTRESASPRDEVQALKNALQEQRRRLTLLNVDMQREIEAREAIQAQLMDALAELEASRNRRKEMARVIANRDQQLQARYAELAALQRHVMRWTVSGRVKSIWRGLRKMARKPNKKG